MDTSSFRYYLVMGLHEPGYGAYMKHYGDGLYGQIFANYGCQWETQEDGGPYCYTAIGLGLGASNNYLYYQEHTNMLPFPLNVSP